MKREQVVGKGLFEVFGDATDAGSRTTMQQSMKRVLHTKAMEEGAWSRRY